MDPKSQRTAPRQDLKQDLSKHLFLPDRTPIRGLGVDISAKGMGVVGFEQLKEGSSVLLLLNKKEIELKVVWTKPDPVRTSIFHSGLEVRDLRHDLVEEFRAAGFLSKVEAWDFNKLRKKPPGKS